MIWSVSDLEHLDGPQEMQRHAGYFCCVFDTVPDWESTDHHVGITNRLHLVDVVIFQNTIETGVQVIEKVYNLNKKRKGWVLQSAKYGKVSTEVGVILNTDLAVV